MGAPEILFVSDTASWPPFQGDAARRAWMVDDFRRHGWRVSWVQVHDPAQRDVDYELMARHCDYLVVQHAELPRHPSAVDPDEWFPPALDHLVNGVVEGRAPVAVVAAQVYLSRCLASLPPSVVRVLDNDLFHVGRRELFEQAGVAHPWFSTDASHQGKAMDRADIVLAVQDEEHAAMRRLRPSARILTVGHGQPSPVESDGPGRKAVGYIGADNEENALGIRAFIAEAWPLVHSRHPDATLAVAGRVCERVADHAGRAGVRIEGVVDDVTGFLRDLDVVVNPNPVGTGIKVKCVDAMLSGRCVVSLPLGFAGLGEVDGAAVVAPSVQAMGALIAELLDDADAVRQIGRRARAWARQQPWGPPALDVLRKGIMDVRAERGAALAGVRHG